MRIENGLEKYAQYVAKKQMAKIDKLMDIQMKYIVEKNLEVVYHDPETGMPRLVRFGQFIKFFQKEQEEKNHERMEKRQKYLQMEIMKRVKYWF